MAAAAILNLKNCKFLTVGTVERFKMHHLAKFRQYRSNRGRDMAIFLFFKMAAAAILDFWNFKFLTVGTVKRVKLHQHAKFRRNRSNRGWDMAILRFWRWRPPPSWICKILNLTVRMVKRFKMHHLAKFRPYRLNRGRDMAIYQHCPFINNVWFLCNYSFYNKFTVIIFVSKYLCKLYSLTSTPPSL